MSLKPVGGSLANPSAPSGKKGGWFNLARVYRLPLKLVTWGGWRKINHPARAILPVIGLHADKSGKSFPGIKLISKLSGYKDLRRVRQGICSLIKAGFLKREKEGRHNVYYLVNDAIWLGGSYFPMNEYLFIKGWWAKLLSCEKAVFVVLAVKGAIADPDTPVEFDDEVEGGQDTLPRNHSADKVVKIDWNI